MEPGQMSATDNMHYGSLEEAVITASWDGSVSLLALVLIQPSNSFLKEQKKNRKLKSIHIIPFEHVPSIFCYFNKHFSSKD